nr:hypothetical protein [Mycoplasmopsis bovis]
MALTIILAAQIEIMALLMVIVLMAIETETMAQVVEMETVIMAQIVA